MAEEWKSPRKVEEEVREYKHKRFEDYMVMADEGKLTRALAITAFREELEHVEEAESVLRGDFRERESA